ncbi:MAG: DUF6600 domain-containing protein [Verrucomicrobiales bacterium]
MKPARLISFATLAVLAATACNKSDLQADAAKADLERQVREARENEAALRTELELQKLNAERDAIALERQKIEDARDELERRNQENADADLEKLRLREEALATREGGLSERESSLGGREQMLNDRELELAGREAIPDLDPTPEIPNSQPVSDYNVFYDQLSNDGSWFQTPDYGYVWQPTVVRDVSWRPYTVGRWACSNRGWTWMSDERFGWATYHYGRWALCSGRGWVWIPGEEWAPAWVCWRSGDRHVGWAPLPPESMGYAHHNWGSTVELELGIGAAWFSFVAINNFGGPIHGHCLPYTQNREWCGYTTNITNITFQNNQFNCGGLSYRDINQRLGRPMPFYQLNVNRFDVNRPGGRPSIVGNQLNIYAPTVNAAWNNALRPASVRDTWRDLQVERSEGGVQSSYSERFRAAQAERRANAAAAVEKLGGQQALQQQRLALLQQNQQEAKQKAQVVLAERQTSIKQRQQETLEKLRAQREAQPSGSAMQALRDKQEQNRLATEQRQKDLKDKQDQAKDDAEKRRQEMADRVNNKSKDPGADPAAPSVGDRLREQQEQNRIAAEQRQKELKDKQDQAKDDAEKRRQEMADRLSNKPKDPGTDPATPSVADRLREQQEQNRMAAEQRQKELKDKQDQAKDDAEKRRQEMADRLSNKPKDPGTDNPGPSVADRLREQQEQARVVAAERQQALLEQQEKANAANVKMKEDVARRAEESRQARQAQQAQAAQMEQARQAQQDKLRQMQEDRQKQIDAAQQQQQMQERQRQSESARQAQLQQQQQAQEQARQQMQERSQQQEQARQQMQERAEQQQRAQEQIRQQMQERAQQQAADQARAQDAARQQQLQRQEDLKQKMKDLQKGR